MKDITAMIEEAKAMASRLNSMLDLIRANLAPNKPEPEPEFRYFKGTYLFWKMPKTGQGFRRSDNKPWTESNLTLEKIIRDGVKEITEEEGEPKP